MRRAVFALAVGALTPAGCSSGSSGQSSSYTDGFDYATSQQQKGLYAFNWGERVRIRGGEGRRCQVTPPAWRSTRSR
jgi:hypothetical protein